MPLPEFFRLSERHAEGRVIGLAESPQRCDVDRRCTFLRGGSQDHWDAALNGRIPDRAVHPHNPSE
jgi:hypothetical protein